MAARKGGCCAWFSCCRNKNTTFTHTHSFESRVTSSTAVAAPPNASHDSQACSPPAAASSILPSFSHSTVTPSALPASSQTIVYPHAHCVHDKVSEVGSSSTSLPKESDHPKNIREAADALDSSEIVNASPAAALTVEERHVTSATAMSLPNASADIVDHDSQPTSPSAASSSQANASKDTQVTQNESQSIALSAVPSSSQSTVTSCASAIFSQTIVSPLVHPAHDKSFQVDSSSNTSSSSFPKESDHANKIREAAEAIDKGNVDADLDELSNYISRLFDSIKEGEGKKKKRNKPSEPKVAKDSWLVSQNFVKLKEVLSEGINVIKDVCPDVKTIAQGFLKGMGMAHMATTGLLVVANILERHEAISSNEEACLSLLKEMNILALNVKELQKRPNLKEGMEASIKEATALIVEASIACCSQIDKNKFSKFFSTSMDQGELANLEKRLIQTDVHMQRQICLCIYDAIERPRKPQEKHYPRYPNHAVGIEKPLRKVIDLLQWESDKKAVAVILHGFGGTGKTTLADAVFARLFDRNIEGCKYSFVRLFENITSTPDIQKLQRCILRDLKMIEDSDIPEFRRYEDGQQQIEDVLKKEVAFIYIDNVLLTDKVEQSRQALEQLLPKNMKNARKLRLLLTSRDKDVLRISRVERPFYPVETLPETEAVELFKRTLDDNEKQLTSNEINQIVQICGGVPKLLMVVAGFICSQENAQKAYSTVMEESEKNWKGDIGKDIEFYVFAYENLDESLRDPFLDICSFFQGWDWEALSNIVGDSELEKLEKRGLVTQDVKSRTASVHDVILTIGLQKTEGKRFTSAKKIQEFLDEKEDEDIRKIKGIWSLENSDPLYIPAEKLDLMHRSLRILTLGTLTEVKGRCAKPFEKLVYFRAEISDPPFDVPKLKELRHLCYKAQDLQNLRLMPPKLRHLELVFDRKCMNPSDFQISDTCLQQLTNLRVLRLTNASLKGLPQKFGDKVKDLQELTLSNCEYLEELKESISKLQCLRVLNLTKSLRLQTLPSSFEKLSSLKFLNLENCENLKALPDDLGNLTSHVTLHLSGCNQLRSIPNSIGQLKLLDSSIDLSYTGLKDLPDEFCSLSFITNLQMHHCASLEKLPDQFGGVTSLRKLSLSYCDHLMKLPESFGQLKCLKHLDLSACSCLTKLPESFGQLKYLEHLDLRWCKSLEELCINFSGLSSLRFLSLDSCRMLKKLPENLDCLISLESLYLCNCSMLEGKWMESIVRMKTLQSVYITGSALLVEKWGEIQRQAYQSAWSFQVYTCQGSSNVESREHKLKQLQSEFDSILANGRKEPYSISDLPLNTLLLVLFDTRQEFYNDFPLSLLEENIDDIQTDFKIIYFCNHFDKLPKKVKDTIPGHALADSNAQALFQKLFAVDGAEQEWRTYMRLNTGFQMSAMVVGDEKGDKYLSCWKRLSFKSAEELVMKKCRRYHKLKGLVEKPGESNMDLVRELFTSGEEESIDFLENDELRKVRVEEFKGKTILLDIRPANMCYDIPLQVLKEMYVAEKAEKDRPDFEIITIPIIQKTTKLGVSEQFSKDIPWLVLHNPWQLKSVMKFFLVEECARWPQRWEEWYPNIMRVIESNGRFVPRHSILRMVNTWGGEAFPFTEEKSRELKIKQRNQMEAMSNLMFLFKHLENVSEQVKKVMCEGKMVCIYTLSEYTAEPEFICSLRNELPELSDSIYIIYIPQFRQKPHGRFADFTDGIYTMYPLLERPKVSSLKIEGMSFLNLSEYEAMRFWAHIYSLKEDINGMDHSEKQLDTTRNLLYSICHGYSSMIMMDEDGRLITTKGKEIVKLLCKENHKNRAKELMPGFIKGAEKNREETLGE